MKTKLVYVLTSNESDYYLEQALLSAYSARIHNPNAVIIVVTDNDTKATLVGKRSLIQNYVTEVIGVDVPSEYSMMQRSRYLKTSLRSIVDGDFLYIDTDTIICDDLSEIDNFECSIGATTDGNGPICIDYSQAKTQFTKMQCEQCNVPYTFEGAPYFNGGVIYSKDDAISEKLFSLWHSNWEHNVPLGVSRDQFPLLCANQKLGWVIQEIPAIYNCQVTEEGLRYLFKAKIIHYYAMVDTNYLLGQREMMEKVKKVGLTEDIVEMVINGAKGAFGSSARIVIPQNRPVEETFFYQLHAASKIGYKVANLISKYIFYLVRFGVRIRNKCIRPFYKKR